MKRDPVLARGSTCYLDRCPLTTADSAQQTRALHGCITRAASLHHALSTAFPDEMRGNNHARANAESHPAAAEKLPARVRGSLDRESGTETQLEPSRLERTECASARSEPPLDAWVGCRS